jgi:trigger factor
MASFHYSAPLPSIFRGPDGANSRPSPRFLHDSQTIFMNTTVEKLPECQAKMRVDFPADAVSGEREGIVKAFQRQAKVPGFRPGKVPKSVIEKRFAEDIEEELITRLVRIGCSDGFKSEDLNVLQVISVEDKELSVDGTFSFNVEVALSPEIELPDYKTIVVKLPNTKIGEDHIDSSMERMREKVAPFEDVEDRAIEEGDVVVINYLGRIDDSPIEDAVPKAAAYLAKGTDSWIDIKEEGFLPGFALQLVGAAKDEKRDVTVRFPADFDVLELQGVEAVYEVEVKEIKIRDLPELDDQFAAKMFEGKTLAEARESVRESMQQHLDDQLEELKANQILQFLHENTNFELPGQMVSNHAQSLVNQMVERGQMRGLSDEEIIEHQDEILGNANQQAHGDVKSRFLLMEVAKAEELTVSQRELAMQIAGLAQRNKTSPKKMAKELKNSDQLDSLREQILASKSLDFLKSNASVEFVEQKSAEEAGEANEAKQNEES